MQEVYVAVAPEMAFRLGLEGLAVRLRQPRTEYMQTLSS